MDGNKYDFLDRTVITIHQEQETHVSRAAFEELRQFAHVQFYDREKMMTISREGRIQSELNTLVKSILTERESHPEGSNTECIAMDMFTEFLSKLDLEEFRHVRIEGLVDETKARPGE